jgi:hypothetical protein
MEEIRKSCNICWSLLRTELTDYVTRKGGVKNVTRLECVYYAKERVKYWNCRSCTKEKCWLCAGVLDKEYIKHLTGV